MRRADLLALAVLVCLTGCAQQRVVLDPPPGSRIVVMGNAFAERMPLYGWFEAALHARFPDRNLIVRNMGWSGDTPSLQPRELNFGTMVEHLGAQRADIMIAAYGMNESFDGEAGLEKFRTELNAWVADMKARRFNGKSAPQIILVSPIAHENLGPPLSDGKAHNANLERYTQVMREVAAIQQIGFVDLFAPAQRKMAAKGPRFTINGIHLNDYGYWWAAHEMADQLGWSAGAPRATGDAAPAISDLRKALWDKDWHFFLRWRPVNMEYIRGRRREPYGIENFPREFDALDRMVEERDRRIWAMSKPTLGQLWQSAPSGPAPWKALPSYGKAGE